MSPIRLDILYPSGPVSSFQRLDYREIWTIDYKMMVKFLGSIHEQSLGQFTKDYEKTKSF